MTFQDLVDILEQTTGGNADFVNIDKQLQSLRKKYIEAYNSLKESLRSNKISEAEFKEGASIAFSMAIDKMNAIVNSDTNLARALVDSNQGGDFAKSYFPEMVVTQQGNVQRSTFPTADTFDPDFNPATAKSFDFSKLTSATQQPAATAAAATGPAVPAGITQPSPNQPVSNVAQPTPLQATSSQTQQTTKGQRLSVGPQPQSGTQLTTGGPKNVFSSQGGVLKSQQRLRQQLSGRGY